MTTQFNIWIATDHPKNNYRTWFHFSISGMSKTGVISFTIKNMQNQVIVVKYLVAFAQLGISTCF